MDYRRQRWKTRCQFFLNNLILQPRRRASDIYAFSEKKNAINVGKKKLVAGLLSGYDVCIVFCKQN